MRKFAISDIHGSYEAMMKLLDYVHFEPQNDQIVFVGDMIDRGPDSGLVLKEVMKLSSTYPDKVIPIIGNHEEMMLWHCARVNDMWFSFGGIEAAKSINQIFYGEIKPLLSWISKLPLTHEDEKFVYAHAGIDIPYGNIEQSRNILWLTKKEFYAFDSSSLLHFTHNKPIVHGHTPFKYATYDGTRISIDLGAQVVESNPKLALVELEEMVSYEFDFSTKKISCKKIKGLS